METPKIVAPCILEELHNNGIRALTGGGIKPKEVIETTLTERGDRYGKFTDHAAICQGLKGVVYGRDGFNRMKPDARQAVDVIFDKIARMVNGDPEYDDNWRDIVGYATLVLNRILGEKQPELELTPANKTT